MTFASASLSGMTSSERRELLDASFEVPPDSVRVKLLEISALLRRYEARYEIASTDLSSALSNKSIQETAEICDWIFWMRIRDRLERPRP